MTTGTDTQGQDYIMVQNVRITRKQSVFGSEGEGLQIAAMHNGKPMMPVQIQLLDEQQKVEFLRAIVKALWP